MLSDEELEPYLNGSQGIAGLDIARELVGLRAELTRISIAHIQTQEQAQLYATTAEMAFGERDAARNQLRNTAELLAQCNGLIRDFLGDTGDPGETS